MVMFDFSKVFSSFKDGKLNGIDAMLLTNSSRNKEQDEKDLEEFIKDNEETDED